MRLAALALVLAACTQSDVDRFNELDASHGVQCGESMRCYTDQYAADVVACLNNAITSGGRAFRMQSGEDSKGFVFYEYDFVVDHHVEVWTYQSSSDGSPEPSASLKGTCSGMYDVRPGTCTGYDEQHVPFTGSGFANESCDFE